MVFVPGVERPAGSPADPAVSVGCVWGGNGLAHVRQAGSAEDGLEIARDEPIDLILMDIRLPGMDGYQALAALRSHEVTKGILTVALTAEAMTGDDNALLGAGFDGYLSKPIDTRNFLREIARVLRGNE